MTNLFCNEDSSGDICLCDRIGPALRSGRDDKGEGCALLCIVRWWSEIADPSAALGGCDFLSFPSGLRPENSMQHLPTNIAEVPSAALGTGSTTSRFQPSVVRQIREVLRYKDDRLFGH
jgi:hypothetical protein